MPNQNNKQCPLFEGIFKEIIFNWMQDNGADRISVFFNGEGDSGSFDDCPVVSPSAESTDDISYSTLNTKFATDKILPLPPGMEEGATVCDFVVQQSELIEANTDHNIDWYNNDGGNGEVVWILDGQGSDGEHYIRGICMTISQRVIEYDTYHYAVRGLIDLPEKEKVTSP